MSEAGIDDGLAIHVGRVLRRIWDPIGLGSRGPVDEYDAYVPDLTIATRDSTVFEDALAAQIARIELGEMHLSLPPAKRIRAARALLGLRSAYLEETGKLIEQRSSPDGLRCLQIFQTHSGFYTYSESVLQQEDDENGRWSWWADAGLGQSGLFDEVETAEREACAVIGWLRLP